MRWTGHVSTARRHFWTTHDDRLCGLGLPSRGAFVTAFSGSLDTASGAFSYSCAGHPPPRLLRARANGWTDRSTPLDGASTQPLECSK